MRDNQFLYHSQGLNHQVLPLPNHHLLRLHHKNRREVDHKTLENTAEVEIKRNKKELIH